ncbi:MAG: deoxyribonuclease IV [Oscillochloridaceae bacterium]|nr:deoxyribonuclease IV [Chloroflexaceae bacterium]MDW8388543.1 deoxyribonuclease IV [Oscillochloridaceae bacterium]
MPFGAHMSIAGGVARAFARGRQVGCETMQIFCKNERQWEARPLTEEEIAAFHAERACSGIDPVFVHASYLINLASPDPARWERSIAACADELERCARLDVPYLVLHPGSHLGSGEETGLARVAAALNRLFASGAGAATVVLLETTAGQGTALGRRFEHLARLLHMSEHEQRLGICVDTCHIFAAGYDIRSHETYAETFATLDRLIGLDQVKCFHLNDSQRELGSQVDRHTHIGQGQIGLEAFRLLVNDPRFRDTPMILETPKGEDMAEDVANLTLLRSLIVPLAA